ncbi:hypothetical protein LR48_Vigan02g049800 [Vigna angularis]|uniref:RNase H type-1 domain-containing protein n=1 Tax=Phaseolus angularis TaxID=3914 RepID=A0A0L9TUT5_PHAAN|nr:uncharacterized protein LOC108325510 [Vigna angularis]KOM34348.1 hypothetical protein LR48_Vigan02g049800 [Vigna angularis]
MVYSKSVLDAKSKVWRGIWYAEAPSRCKSVAWRACNEELLVKSLLVEKRILNDATCPSCGKAAETTVHALLQCEEIKRVWFASPLGLKVELLGEVTSFSQLLEQFARVLDEKGMGMVCAIIWSLWQRRNVRVFENKKLDCKHVIAKAWSMIAFQKWVPPPVQYVKANFAALVIDNLGTGMGVVFRNSSGVTLASGTNLLEEEIYDPKIGAALCFKWAADQSGELGFSNVIFETDCKILHTHWNLICEGQGMSEISYLDSVLEDVKVMIEGTGSSFSLVRPTANKVAQRLAEAAFGYGEKIWMDVVPEEASLNLRSDMAAIAADK